VVVGLADGKAFGPLTVSNAGQVVLPSSIPTTVAKVQVGLPIRYSGQPMRMDSDARQGNTQSRTKQDYEVYLRLYNSCGGYISNGTTTYPTWVSGRSYAVGDYVISPATKTAYQCTTASSGTTDPSTSTAWVAAPTPVYNPPVAIPYTGSQTNPFAVPTMITDPTDIVITKFLQITPDTDPIVILTANDALPLTVLGINRKYDVVSNP